jgi:hypothetical protein
MLPLPSQSGERLCSSGSYAFEVSVALAPAEMPFRKAARFYDLSLPVNAIAVSGLSLYSDSDRGALLGPGRMCGVEFPVALLDASGSLVPGNRGADMIWASSSARGGNFLLYLAGCQGKDLIAQARRGALAASQSCGCSPSSASWRWSGLRCCGRRFGWGGLSCLCAPGVAASTRSVASSSLS